MSEISASGREPKALILRMLPQSEADLKSQICGEILRKLPDWVGVPDAIYGYEKSVREWPLGAVFIGGRAIGFIALREHNPFSAEIEVMGVLTEYQRKGVGKMLVDASAEYCTTHGKSVLLVKTVDYSCPDEFYARTRAFYLALDFVPLQILDGYWDENNTCLLLGKWLGYSVSVCAVTIDKQNADSSELIEWLNNWDWSVGKLVANRIRNTRFSDSDAIIAAKIDGQYAGLCILEEHDDYAVNRELSPFISAVYVDPKYRGRRISEKLLLCACERAKVLGFRAVYLVSGEQGLYEKYGFEPFAKTLTLSGREEAIYRKIIGNFG
jgi:GNAT superfamily N-acetyltransferase